MVFNDKKMSRAGYLIMYALASYVYATPNRVPTVVHVSVDALEACGKREFYPTWVAA